MCEVIPDAFQRVCRRTEDGERFTKDLLKYIEKRSKIEAAYSKVYRPVSNLLLHRSPCQSLLNTTAEIFKQEQEIGTLKAVWESLRAETEAVAKVFLPAVGQLSNFVPSNLRCFIEVL